MVRIKDVADRAGVSVASVSRVLSDDKWVSASMRERVLQAVRELDYSVDQRARALRRQTSGTLGLIISDVANPFFGQVMRSIEAVAYESNHSLFLCNSDEDPEREAFHVQAMLAQRIDGIIVLPVTNSGRTLAPLVNYGIPVVCLDRRVDDLSLDAVLVDNVRGGMAAVEHLAELGHVRIGIIGGRESTPGLERMAGYHRAMAQRGLSHDPDLIRHGDFKQESGYAEANRLLSLAEPPSAIFVVNHPMTLGALVAIRERRLRVPRDISVIGFDDPAWASLLGPPLTAISQPTDELGAAAARLLLDRVDKRYSGPARRIVWPPVLMPRASTGPAPAAGRASAATWRPRPRLRRGRRDA